jgi:Spy/CpxP family protein refolding chaperone
MKKLILAATLALSAAAFAQGQPADEGRAQRREQFMQMRVNHIGQELGLDQNGTQRLQQTFESFKGRQQALHQQMKAQMEILRAAASGDQNAAGQVDGAISQLEQLRQQQFQLRQDTFNAVAQGLTPVQKAKLVFALRPKGEGHRGHKHGFGRWQQAPWNQQAPQQQQQQ